MFESQPDVFSNPFLVKTPSSSSTVLIKLDEKDTLFRFGQFSPQIGVMDPTILPVLKTLSCYKSNNTLEKEQEEAPGVSCRNNHGIQTSGFWCSWFVIESCSPSTSNSAQGGGRLGYWSSSVTCGAQRECKNCICLAFRCDVGGMGHMDFRLLT